MRRRSHAFSMIEVLVVIVVLLVGILAMMRIFPSALVGLSVTRDHTLAQILARRQLDQLAAAPEDLPHQILAVRYIYVPNGGGWNLVLQADPDVSPRDLGPGGPINEDGFITIDNPGGADTLIFWRYYNDANRIRRIIGEGGPIPAPRPVGTDFGGMRTLNFGPIVDDPALLLVYSDNMDGRRIFGSSPGEARGNPRQWEFHHDDDVPQIWLPGVPGRDVSYKVNFSYWELDAGNYRRVDIIDRVVTVRPGFEYNPTDNIVFPFNLQDLAGNPATWFAPIAYSVSANRLFDRVGVFSADYPYEFKLLNGNLGTLLFNPVSYNYRERRGRGTRPLTAQVNYDVYNWHIIRDEFRADRTRSPIHKLSLSRIKALNDLQNDQRRYPGLEFPVPNGVGGFSPNRDIVIVDLDTGGTLSRRINPGNNNSALSYKIDYLRGVIALASPMLPPPGGPNDLANGVTIILPDAAQTQLTNVNPAGRNFKVLYQAHNDWAVQVMKAPSRISVMYGLPLSIAQCYIGGSNPNLREPGLPTRIYFPRADEGAKVTIREIWYRDAPFPGGNLKVLRDQDFLVRFRAQDAVGLPSVDIKEIDDTAEWFDFQTYGYAVRGVAGSSIRARVIWNSAEKADSLDDDERMWRHESWTQQWRKVVIDNHLTRRAAN